MVSWSDLGDLHQLALIRSLSPFHVSVHQMFLLSRPLVPPEEEETASSAEASDVEGGIIIRSVDEYPFSSDKLALHTYILRNQNILHGYYWLTSNRHTESPSFFDTDWLCSWRQRQPPTSSASYDLVTIIIIQYILYWSNACHATPLEGNQNCNVPSTCPNWPPVVLSF